MLQFVYVMNWPDLLNQLAVGWVGLDLFVGCIHVSFSSLCSTSISCHVSSPSSHLSTILFHSHLALPPCLFCFDCCWCSMWETHATSVFVLVGVAWGKPHAIWELVFVHLVSVSQWLSWVCIVVSSDWFSLCGLSPESQWESPMHGEPWRCSTV